MGTLTNFKGTARHMDEAKTKNMKSKEMDDKKPDL